MKKSLIFFLMYLTACTQESAHKVSNNSPENKQPLLLSDVPPLSVPTTGFKDIFVKHGRACALKIDGTPLCWGKDFSGGRKLEGEWNQVKFKKVFIGDMDVVGLDLDGKIRAWLESKDLMESINEDGPFMDFAVANGTRNIVAVKADGSLAHRAAPYSKWDVSLLPKKVKMAVAGDNRMCFLTTDNTLSCVGPKGSENLAIPGSFDRLSMSNYLCARSLSSGITECSGIFFSDYPKEVSLKIEINSHDVAAGEDHICVLRTDNKVTCFDLETHEEDRAKMVPPASLDSVYKISVGLHEACAIQNIDGEGRIVCWGHENSQVVSKALGNHNRANIIYGESK